MKYPFIKLVIDSHEDKFYKVYDDALQIEGRGNNGYVTKDLLTTWTKELGGIRNAMVIVKGHLLFDLDNDGKEDADNGDDM